MLKRLAFVFGLILACSQPLFAQAGAGAALLVVGDVRDQSGLAVPAEVEATDASGKDLGRDRTQGDGTFSILAGGRAAFVVVRCRFCVESRVGVQADVPVVVIVRRYAGLQRDIPTARDVAALPYAEIGDDLGLAPYVVPGSQGTTVTDLSIRGLERGRGLTLDDGVPAYDLATGTSGVADLPSRTMGDATILEPSRGFAYGSYASGGTFAITPERARTSLHVSTGLEPSLALRLHADRASAGVALSKNADQVIRRRAEVSYDAPFAGGNLELGAAAAALVNDGMAMLVANRDVARAHVSYATASRRYRTFLTVGGSRLQSSLGQDRTTPTGASELFASVRVEHPGPLSLAYGLLSQRFTGHYDVVFAGRVAHDLVYAQAAGGSERVSFDLGASVSEVSAVRSLGTNEQRADAQAALLSLSVKTAIGRSFHLGGTVSTSLRVPTLGEASAEFSLPNRLDLERGSLAELELAFEDQRRIRVAGIAFHENLNGFGDRSTEGLGLSLAWQATPLVLVRAWTLRDDVRQYGVPNVYSLQGPSTLGRGVVWSTYENPVGLRFDAIAHRDAYAAGVVTNIDGDLVVPLRRGLDLDLGSYREDSLRRSSVSLRF